jgi:hypothetical protein
VAMSYIFVRKDLGSFLPDPESQGLLVAFLRALYTDSYIEQCERDFGFAKVGGTLKDKALAGIDMLQLSADAPTFTFEDSTDARTGQGDHVISAKRESYSEIEQDNLVALAAALTLQMAELQTLNEKLTEQVATLAEERRNDHVAEDAEDLVDFTTQEETQLNASLVLAALSFSFWIISFVVLTAKFGCNLC